MIGEIARLGWTRGFAPGLARALSLASNAEFDSHVRNSGSRKGDFHLLFSDLDLAYVGAFDSAQASIVRKWHDRTRKVVPTLGELEIYDVDGWERRNRSLTALGEHFEALRTYRKAQWMKRYIAEAKTPFSRLRAERGLKKCLEKMGRPATLTDDSRYLSSVASKLRDTYGIDERTFEGRFDYFHPWLEKEITTSGRENALPLSTSDAIFLAAIFPIRTYWSPALDEAVESHRRDPSIRKHLRLFSQLELEMMTASVRGYDEVPQWFQANKPDLEYWIANA